MSRRTRRQQFRPWTAFEEGRGRVSRAKRRLAVLASCILLAPIFLGMRLFNLQIVKAEEMRLHRTRNLHGVEWLHAKRGNIVDARGHVLVEDESQFVLRFVYRDFRRGHGCGLLVHLDRFLRELQSVTRDGPDGAIVPDGIVDGEPLTYVDPVERFESAALRTLDLPISLLRRDGPLGKRLRSVLRFYVFHVLDQTTTLRRHGIPVARVFEGLDGADRDLPVATFVASSGVLPWTAADVAGEVVARVRKQIAALDELAGILGPRLTLPGSMTRVAGKGSAAGWVSEHGDLFSWLDACDRLHDRRTDARVDELRARQAEFVPGFWSRVFDAWFPGKAAEGTTLSRRLANALTAGTRGGKHATEFEERIALRFRSEYGPVVVDKPVEFESVVALVLGKRESYPGFEVGEELRRRYPTLDPRGRPYSILGITQWRESVDDAVKPTLVLGDELDSDVDGTKRLHLAEDEREIWQEEVKRRLLSEFRVREGLNNLEAYLDPLLTGQAGWRALLRDRTGQERFSPTHVAARRGHDVELTIDHEVQDLLDSALEEASLETINGHSLDRAKVKASFALIDAVTGDIRGMAWLPRTWHNDLLDIDIPDRSNPTCVHRWQPSPGSVLKPVFAVEGIVQGFVDGHEYEICSGHYGSGWNRISCDCRNRWQSQSLQKALRYSCNSYFGQLGQQLTFEGLQRALLRFGLLAGTDNNIRVLGLRVDPPGPVPRERRSLLQRSIGYGWRMPPILLARAYAALGTGRLPPLQIVARVDGEAVDRPPSTPLDVGDDVLDRVRRGMIDVPLSDGTARHAGLQGDRVAAKTGTAEVLGKAANNASFAGYVPWDAPRLAFCITFWETPPKIHGGDFPARALAIFLRSLEQRPALHAMLFGDGERPR